MNSLWYMSFLKMKPFYMLHGFHIEYVQYEEE